MYERRISFSSSHLRLRQASEIRQEFQSKWRAYAEAKPYWIGLVRDDNDPLRYTLVAKVLKAPPGILGMLFSEWLHHLRASLDNAIYALAIHSSGQNPPPRHDSLYYPICLTPREFKGRKLPESRLTEHAVEMIASRQPYSHPDGARHSYLFWLNELARMDRHRMPHLCVGRITIGQIRRLHAGVQFVSEQKFDPTEILERDTPLQAIRTEKPLGSLNVEYVGRKPNVLPEVREWAEAGSWTKKVDDITYVDGYPKLLDRMERVETETLEAFAEMVKLAGLNPAPIMRDFARSESLSQVVLADEWRMKNGLPPKFLLGKAQSIKSRLEAA